MAEIPATFAAAVAAQLVDAAEVVRIVQPVDVAEDVGYAANADAADSVQVAPIAVADVFSSTYHHEAVVVGQLAHGSGTVHVVQLAVAVRVADFPTIADVADSVEAVPPVAGAVGAVVVVLDRVVEDADLEHGGLKIRVAHAAYLAAIVGIARALVVPPPDGKTVGAVPVAEIAGHVRGVCLRLLAPSADFVPIVDAAEVVQTHLSNDRLLLAFCLAVRRCRQNGPPCARDSAFAHVHFVHNVPCSRSRCKHARSDIRETQHYRLGRLRALFRFAAKGDVAALDYVAHPTGGCRVRCGGVDFPPCVLPAQRLR